MRTRTCVEAADFVALSVALAVDPAVSGANPEAESAEPASAPPDASSAPPPAEASLPRASTSSHPKPASAPEPPAISGDAPPTEPMLAMRWSADAGGRVDFFSLPSARLGVAAHLGASFGKTFISLGAEWLPTATEPVPNATSDVNFSRLSSELHLGYAWTRKDVELAPYVEGQLGQILASSAEYSKRVPWLAVGAGGQVTWLASGWFQPFGSLGALVPLERATFVLSGGTQVHEVPALTVEAGIGARTIF